ncbi:MAG: DNA repair protein RadA [Betaproteobacteria bacterium]|nr:DNA repair protein RadA [Betaproteobacteria bacterium]
MGHACGDGALWGGRSSGEPARRHSSLSVTGTPQCSHGRPKTVYTCRECGGSNAKWLGKCPHCGAWNSLDETVAEAAGPAKNRFQSLAKGQPVATLSEIDAAEVARTPTGQEELDRVLGGGIVEGAVVLIGGDPGIGKSTLLLQALDALSGQMKVLYVTGEESAAQVALRARRLGLSGQKVRVLAEIQLEKIVATLENEAPAFCVIDSIQTVYSDQLTSAPGSVSQVRECAAQLTRLAKTSGVAMVFVGHVTKEGALAGPRVLEHMVDTVLYFEGDTHSSFRLVRAIKNRFGAVNEIGVFAMTERGLKGVSNPSAIFLSTHGDPVPGSCVLVTLEGTRPLLVEVQALVDSGGPSPRRLSVGLDRDRLAMLLAVLHRHAGVSCMDQDVFVNAVGGVRISEPAADLAVLLAIQGSLRGRALPRGFIAFGEVGLAGEVRPAPRGQERLKEAAKLGFSVAVVPKANAPKKAIEGLTIHAVERIEQAIEVVRGLT